MSRPVSAAPRGRRRIPRPARAAAIAVGLTAAIGVRAIAADPGAPPDVAASALDAVKMLADVTVIDDTCRSVSVNFGRAFEVAAELGLPPTAVMPTGPSRPAFEAAMLDRRAQSSQAEICGSVAQAYGDHIPGLIGRR